MILKRVFFVLHLGVIVPVYANYARQTMYAIAGKPLTLPCQSHGGLKTKSVIWKYETNPIVHYRNQGTPYKGAEYSAYNLEDADKGKFSLVIPDAKVGRYTCDIDGNLTYFDLHVLSVTGSHNGYLLEGETLELKLDSSDRASVKEIEWYSPHKAIVTSSNKPRWAVKDNDWTLQIMNLSFQEDNGTWECQVSKLKIPYDVKVLGFQNPSSLQLLYAAVNSSVTLSYPLSVKLGVVPGISAVMTWKLTEDNTIKLPIAINASSTFPVKSIYNVQFEDAGQYQCQIQLNHRTLNKSIHLVVMKVSAQPLQITLKEANLSLCCHVSAPIHLVGRLQWSNLNTTIEDHSERAHTFCVSPRTGGLWTCSLLVDKDVKIRINYTVTVADGQVAHHPFPVIQVTVGVVGPLLLLLILTVLCVVVCKTVAKKRQQAKRMAQAKEHLLAKRTCRCQKELMNDYYHA